MPLAGQNVSQRIRTFWGWKPSKIRTLNLIKVLPVLIKKCCPLCKCEINTEREENLSEKEWLVLLIIKLYIAGHNIYVENIFRHIDTFFQKQPSRGVLRKWSSKNLQQMYRKKPMPKGHFNKVTLQLYWNCTLAWVFSCKFATYFQNTFS